MTSLVGMCQMWRAWGLCSVKLDRSISTLVVGMCRRRRGLTCSCSVELHMPTNLNLGAVAFHRYFHAVVKCVLNGRYGYFYYCFHIFIPSCTRNKEEIWIKVTTTAMTQQWQKPTTKLYYEDFTNLRRVGFRRAPDTCCRCSESHRPNEATHVFLKFFFDYQYSWLKFLPQSQFLSLLPIARCASNRRVLGEHLARRRGWPVRE